MSTTYCFSVHTDAEPSALPRVMEVFARLGHVPTRCHVERGNVSAGAGDRRAARRAWPGRRGARRPVPRPGRQRGPGAMVREAARRGLTLSRQPSCPERQRRAGARSCAPESPSRRARSVLHGRRPKAIAIAPAGGTFAALSHMTIRPLVKTGADATGLERPRWLAADPDDAGPGRAAGLAGTTRDRPGQPVRRRSGRCGARKPAAASWAVSPRSCSRPANSPRRAGADEWRMRCDFTADGLGLYMASRVVARGESAGRSSMRAANEQRLRHFEAIANSFQPP